MVFIRTRRLPVERNDADDGAGQEQLIVNAAGD